MELKDLLSQFVARNASDLHLTAQWPPTLRVEGNLAPITSPDGEPLSPLEPEAVARLFSPYFSGAELSAMRGGQDVNTSIEWENNRFRCCIFRDRAGMSAALRLIPVRIPNLADLFGDKAEIFRRLTASRRGLILLVGGIGSGKSTTVAAMLHEINTERSERIITIEDPIEYLHSSKQSLVSQREVGKDVDSLEQGALSAFRSDLDVALVGELRTPEAVRIVLTLAETGHLVFSTLLADTVSEAIQRLIESFPDSGDTMRRMLARTLQAVIAQRLLPATESHRTLSGQGRLPANEILLATPRVRQMITEGQADLTLAMEAGHAEGMQTMDDAILDHYRAGLVSYEVAAIRMEDSARLGPPSAS